MAEQNTDNIFVNEEEKTPVEPLEEKVEVEASAPEVDLGENDELSTLQLY